MNYFFWLALAVAAYLSIKNAKSSKTRNLFIMIYAAIIIIGLAYFSGEAIGEMLYVLSIN